MVFYKKFMCFFLVFIFIFIFTSSSFCATDVLDVQAEILQNNKNAEARFVSLCYYPFINNTTAWNESLLPIFNTIINNNYCTYIQINNSNASTTRGYNVMMYYPGQSKNSVTRNFTSAYDLSTYQIAGYEFPNTSYKVVKFYPSTNTFNVSTDNWNINFPQCCYYYRSDLFTNFLMDIKNNSVNYDNYLNSIRNSLLHINDINEDILGYLVQISIQISNLNNSDYSTDLSGISSSINSILNDNQTIISQNNEMVQQQEQINNNLETLNDNLMDDNFDNSNLNLPTNDTVNSADSGINNIFTNMYNAFCTGVAQDIILPIPFTSKNIIIEPDFLYNALYNSNANWLILFIQAFWGYLIGRFIVLDVNNKFNKIKSGNIENLENSNIKGDLL